jgi:hypothetical protein
VKKFCFFKNKRYVFSEIRINSAGSGKLRRLQSQGKETLGFEGRRLSVVFQL